MSYFDDASLVMIPSGKKAGKVYSVKPTDGTGDLDFTRASTATRIGPDGKIEKTRTNLLLQSNTFNTSWTVSGAVIVGGQSGYDGANNAWKLTSTAAGTPQILQSGSSNLMKTHSIYAKAGNVSELKIWVGSAKVFNLSNGTTSSSNSKMTNVGNGWYRCEVFDVFSNMNPFFSATAADEFIYIQDAQQNYGTVATDVITTTSAAVSVGSVDNMPRLNYTFNSSSSCPSLLLEPQRTNLETQSEYFEGWSLVSNVTRTTNYATSPDGTQNASRLQFTANGFLGNTTLSSGTEYTLSCYAKRNDSGSQSFGFFKDGSGAVDSEMALTSNWQRFTYTYTAGNSSFAGLAASSGADVSVFGYQIEAANFESSYIPTFGATVTRVVDATSLSGLQSNSLLGTNKGTVFFHYGASNSYTGSNGSLYYFEIDSNNRLSTYLSSGTVRLFARAAGSTVFNESTTIAGDSEFKIAVAYDSTNTLVYINGVLTHTIAGFSLALTDFSIPQGDQALESEKFLFFNTKLNATQLAELTS